MLYIVCVLASVWRSSVLVLHPTRGNGGFKVARRMSVLYVHESSLTSPL